MFSTFPSTPRGRSRFSKALPVPPGETSETSPAALTPRSLRTDLPPLPSDAVKAPMLIPRRPIGGGVGGDIEKEKAARPASIASESSVYSDSAGFLRSPSGSSTKEECVSGIDSADGPTPQLPAKDKDREISNEKPQTTHKRASISISSFDAALHPTEIWRRRSAKSEHSIVFSDLKLTKSNGSTASPPQRQEQPTDQTQLPRSITGRKPVPARPAPPQPEFMGNKISKLGKKGSREDSSNDGPYPAQAHPHAYESVQRLPTPEYLKADKQHSIDPSILSPVSPFTPPDDKPPLVPRKSESRSLSVSNNSSEATIVPPTTTVPTPENDLPTRPNLLAAHSRDGSDALTITSESVTMRAPQPQKPSASARILTPQPSSGKASPLSLQSPAALAAYFPTIKSPAARGAILPGPALDLFHYECYHSHKVMRISNNRVCPVACMICQRQDTDKRLRCTWCCLSVCGSCSRVLDSVPGKNLRIAVERIGNRA